MIAELLISRCIRIPMSTELLVILFLISLFLSRHVMAGLACYQNHLERIQLLKVKVLKKRHKHSWSNSNDSDVLNLNRSISLHPPSLFRTFNNRDV